MVWLYVGLGALALVFLNRKPAVPSSAPAAKGIDALAPTGAPPPVIVPPTGYKVVKKTSVFSPSVSLVPVPGIYTPTVEARSGRGHF